MIRVSRVYYKMLKYLQKGNVDAWPWTSDTYAISEATLPPIVNVPELLAIIDRITANKNDDSGHSSDDDTPSQFQRAILLQFITHIVRSSKIKVKKGQTPINLAHDLLAAVTNFAKSLDDQNQNFYLPAYRVLLTWLSTVVTTPEEINESIGFLFQRVFHVFSRINVLNAVIEGTGRGKTADARDNPLLGRPFVISMILSLSFRAANLTMAHKVVDREVADEQALRPIIQPLANSPDGLRDLALKHYLVGKTLLMGSKFPGACANLHRALSFTSIHDATHPTQPALPAAQTAVAPYLVPCLLLDGRLPSAALVDAADKVRGWNYKGLVESVAKGRVGRLCMLLEKAHDDLVTEGLYFIWEELRATCLLNLIQSVFKIWKRECKAPPEKLLAKQHQLPLTWVLAALNGTMEEFRTYTATLPDEDRDLLDDVYRWDMGLLKARVVGLLGDKRIKGYLSLQMGIVVLSKDVAFPGLRRSG